MAMTRTCSGKLGRHGCWDCFLFGGMLRKKNSEVWLLNPWELWILGGCGDLGTDDSTFWFVPVVFLVVVELKMDQNASICCTGMYWEFGYWIAMDWLEQENVPRHSQLFFSSLLFECWLVVWNIFYFSIYWEQSFQLTNIFQRDWNHQPDYVGWYPWNLLWWCNTLIWCGSTLRAKSVVVFKFFFRHCCWVWCWWTQISTRLMMMKNKENNEHGPLSLMMYHYLPIENGEQSFHVRKCLVWHSNAFHVCRVPGVPRLLRPRRLRPRHQPRLPRVPPRPRHAVWHDRVDLHDHESSGEEVLHHQQTHHRWIEWNDGGWSEDVCRASQELLIGAWYQWSIKRA